MTQQYPNPNQYPQYPPYPQPAPPKKRHTVRWVILGIVGMFVLIGIIVGATSGGGSSSGAPGASSTGYPDNPKTDPGKVQPIPVRHGTFGDGTWEVGKDIKAGTYKTIVPADSIGGYWERDKDLNGGINSIIDNGIGNPGAHVTVSLKAGTVFTTADCGTWQLQK